MTTDIATIHVESTPEDSHFRIPSGYERWVRPGANWTMIISPYMILYFILVITLGRGGDNTGNFASLLGRWMKRLILNWSPI